jgi:hypothetical protein
LEGVGAAKGQRVCVCVSVWGGGGVVVVGVVKALEVREGAHGGWVRDEKVQVLLKGAELDSGCLVPLSHHAHETPPLTP